VKVAAFIPARGGSKRVPGKNLAMVGNEALVARACTAAREAGCSVVVSTDSDKIALHVTDISELRSPLSTVTRYGYEIHHRPAQLASDHAQIEDAIAHWWVRCDDKPDVLVLLQPTSPFRTAEHVREALQLLEATHADSVIGVTTGHEAHFAGRLKPRSEQRDCNCRDATCSPIDKWFDWQPFSPFDAKSRPRTQDLSPRGHENGAIYVTRREAWEKSCNRVSGHVVAYPMNRWEGFDIDTPDDLAVAQALAEARGW
jgi:CMP-N-acetylneuraminic acid synthetase